MSETTSRPRVIQDLYQAAYQNESDSPRRKMLIHAAEVTEQLYAALVNSVHDHNERAHNPGDDLSLCNMNAARSAITRAEGR